MLLTSFWFLALLLIIILLSGLVDTRWRWILLLAASAIFYASWGLGAIISVLVIGLTSYAVGRLMSHYPHHKKRWLSLGTLGLLGVLAWFKYWGFLTGLTNSWLAPVGLSFYIFQTVGYLIDVYRGTINAEKHVGHYLLFVMFFPHALAGPIARAGPLLAQLKQPPAPAAGALSSGLQLFLLGMFRKVVIADNLARIVNTVFDALPNYKGLSLVITVFLYSWQIYADFAGYTDMARGSAKMLGIDLLPNFNQPYRARSLQDFWRRWHQSLSNWFRDYLYIPLGGNRRGHLRTALNVILVFALCGLWHGAAWTFVIWGLAHGLYLALERYLKLPALGPLNNLWLFAIVSALWVLFRSPTLADAAYIYRYSLSGLINIWQPAYWQATLNQIYRTNQVEMIITAFVLLATFTIEWFQSRPVLQKLFHQQPFLFRSFVYALAIVAIVVLRDADVKQFIYIQF